MRTRIAPRVAAIDGFTLIELLVAVVLFAGAMMIAGRTVVGFVHDVGVSEARAQAMEFALEEMERVQLLPYDQIAASGPEAVPEAPEYERRVDVRTEGNDPSALYGYRVITVTVEPPSGLQPVSVTIAVGEQ